MIKIAIKRKVKPLGTIRNWTIAMVGLEFDIAFVALRMEDNEGPSAMLLGRPWTN